MQAEARRVRGSTAARRLMSFFFFRVFSLKVSKKKEKEKQSFPKQLSLALSISLSPHYSQDHVVPLRGDRLRHLLGAELLFLICFVFCCFLF